jgi:hypothetical protein
MTNPPLTFATPSPKRRVFDLLVIVVIACGLLGLAWRVTRERLQVEEVSRGSPLAGGSLPSPETPELSLTLPLEKYGMGLTRQHVEGDSQQALAALDQQCREVLASAEEWVLSLAISPEEQQLLDSLGGLKPLPDIEAVPRVGSRSASERPFAPRKATLAQLYPLTQPTGRAGVREMTPQGGPISPSVKSSPTAASNGRESGQSPQDDPGSGAVAGRRLICWGFIVSDGAGGHTVWFAQPREKLPRSVSREGHAP